MSRRGKAFPIVTLGVCVKNAERTIGDCIDTITRQTYSKRRIDRIIVDGNSTDKTLRIIQSALAHARIQSRIYSDHSRGLGFARHLVVSQAKGEYVVFVDADVELTQDFVQKQVEFMENNLSVGASIGRYMCKRGNRISTLWGISHELAFDRFIGTDAVIFRRQALEDAGNFDTNIRGAAEDLDAFMRIKSEGWQITVNASAPFFHKCRGSLRELLTEENWFGYGNHYLLHKNKSSHLFQRYIRSTLGCVPYSLHMASKVYQTKHWKSSFAIPILFVLARIAWWGGFVRAHLAGYGHGILPNQILEE